MSRIRLFPAVLLALAASAAAAQASLFGPPEETSQWRAGDIKVDGYIEDWRGQEADDSEGFDFAFRNDADDLYLYLNPHTKTTRAQLSGEFGQEVTLWLDPKGGKARTVGIKLAPPEQVEDGKPRLIMLFGVAGSTTWAEPPEEDRVSAVMGSMLERGALEARIPLKYIGIPGKRRIGIGLTTGPAQKGPDVEQRKEVEKQKDEGEKDEDEKHAVSVGGEASGGWGGAGSGGGGGMHAGRHGRRGGGGGRRTGPRHGEPASAEPLEVWVQVLLAKPPAPKP